MIVNKMTLSIANLFAMPVIITTHRIMSLCRTYTFQHSAKHFVHILAIMPIVTLLNVVAPLKLITPF